MIFLDVSDDLFADVATQVPALGGIGRGGEPRICIVFSVASVTCKFQKRLSQSGWVSMISLSALRSSSSGMV